MHRSKVEEEESKEGGASSSNAFKNDGSFMEMFKKMQEEEKEKEKDKEVKEEKKILKRPLFGKRRGGRSLPTGKVKKPKMPSESDGPISKDAWSVYLEEVRRYKETTCEEDGKTRPLVK